MLDKLYTCIIISLLLFGVVHLIDATSRAQVLDSEITRIFKEATKHSGDYDDFYYTILHAQEWPIFKQITFEEMIALAGESLETTSILDSRLDWTRRVNDGKKGWFQECLSKMKRGAYKSHDGCNIHANMGTACTIAWLIGHDLLPRWRASFLSLQDTLTLDRLKAQLEEYRATAPQRELRCQKDTIRYMFPEGLSFIHTHGLGIFTQQAHEAVRLKESLHLWGVESELGEHDEKRANNPIALYQIIRTAAEAEEWSSAYRAFERALMVPLALRRGMQWGLGAGTGIAACGLLFRLRGQNIIAGSALGGTLAFLGISLYAIARRKHHAILDAWYQANPLIPEDQWDCNDDVRRLQQEYPQALKKGMTIRSLQGMSSILEAAVKKGVPCYGGSQYSMQRLAPGLSENNLGVISFIRKVIKN